MSWRVEHGDCVEVMAAMPEASVDAIVCDPPYGLEFMGKDWDRLGATVEEFREALTDDGRVDFHGKGNAPFGGGGQRVRYGQTARAMQDWHEAWAREALRVLKPGGHLLAFGGTRTYHRLTSGIEDAGFEVRDMVDWLYGSGFPKSLDVGDGRGTALKPGHEPVCVARKPLGGTVAATVAEHGTGALNIDACRIPTDEKLTGSGSPPLRFGGTNARPFHEVAQPRGVNQHESGRWPANVVLDREAAALLDEQTGELAPGNHPAVREGIGYTLNSGGRNSGTEGDRRPTEAGGASRFFYVAKADTAERNAGLGDVVSLWAPADTPDRNDHPTVKPIDLMRWLVRLVTPPGGTVLDPFTGSGTTGCAAVLEGLDFVGIEREAAYVSIARARIAHWSTGSTEAAA